MTEVSRLTDKTGTPPEFMQEAADALRRAADRIEAGATIGVAWVEKMRGDQYHYDWHKMHGISMFDLAGQIDHLSWVVHKRIDEDS